MLPSMQQHAGAIHPLTSSAAPNATTQSPLSTNCSGISLPSGAGHSGIHMPMQHAGGLPAGLTGATAMPARPGCSSGISGPTRSVSPMAWSGCSGNTMNYGCGSSGCSGQTVVVPLSVGRSTEAASVDTSAGSVDTSGCVWYPAHCGVAYGVQGGCQPGFWGPPPGSCELLGLPSNCNPGAGGGISPCSPTCKPGPGGPPKKNVTDAHKIWNLALYMYGLRPDLCVISGKLT